MMNTTETPCRWRPRKHRAGEEHGNTVWMKSMETLCRWRTWKHPADEEHGNTMQTDSPGHIASKMSRNLESCKAHVLLSDSKGVWEFSPKVSVFPTKDADATPMNNLAGMALGLKSTHGVKYWSSVKIMWFAESVWVQLWTLLLLFNLLFQMRSEGFAFLDAFSLGRPVQKSLLALFA